MVRLTAMAAAMALACGIAGGARADQGGEALPWQAMDTATLAAHSGGSDAFDASMVVQGNTSDTDGTNHHNQITNSGPGARMENGAISETTISGNHGVMAAMQNTGNLVNMNYSMNVNVYLK